MKAITTGRVVSASLLSFVTQAQTTPEVALPDSVKYSPKFIVRDAPVNFAEPMILFLINNEVVPFDSLKNINTKHIKSLHVLKAPEAAALYGSRAMNGAVIVALKKNIRRQKQK
jgi:TonB-dependent SusC/RagA subfamily outer membrane receptor